MANNEKMEVEIKASTAKANAELSKLIKILDSVANGFSRITEKELTRFTKGIDKLGKSIQSISRVKSPALTQMADDLTRIAKLDSMGLTFDSEAVTNYQSGISAVTDSVGLLGEKIVNVSEALVMMSANMASLKTMDSQIGTYDVNQDKSGSEKEQEDEKNSSGKWGDAFKGLSTVNSAMESVDKFKKSINDSALVKTTAEASKKIEEFARTMEKLKSGGLLENTDLLSKLADTMALVAGAGDVKNLQDWVDSLQSSFGKADGVATIITSITLAVSNFFSMWENGFSWLNEAVMVFGIALAAVGAVIVGAPVLIAAVVAGIVALIATIAVVIHDNWDNICALCSGIPEWFNNNIIEPIVSFFVGLGTRVGQIFEGLWIIVEALWILASDWFNENVIIPLVGFFQNLWADISSIFINLWNDIQEVWASVSGWFEENIISPLSSAFETACEAIGTFFDGLWSGIKSGVVGAMNSVIGGIESAINWIVDGINDIISGFNRIVSWAAKVADEDWGGVDLVPRVYLGRISGYASGGYPETGELFLARENGVNEMIGRIGSKSAVANNDQIVQAITNAVAPAVYEAVSAALMTGSLGANGQPVVLEAEFIADSETLYKVVKKGERKADRRYHVMATI